MTRFAGYARKPEPRWFNIGLTTLIILAIALVWFLYYAAGQWFERLTTAAPAATTTTTLMTVPVAAQPADQIKPIISATGSIKVERVVVASGVDENYQPVDDLAEVDPAENGTVYCFSRQSAATLPAVFKHVWLGPSGRVVAEINLSMSRSPASTYSYINLSGASKGPWEVQVRDGAGNIVGRRGFTIN